MCKMVDERRQWVQDIGAHRCERGVENNWNSLFSFYLVSYYNYSNYEGEDILNNFVLWLFLLLIGREYCHLWIILDITERVIFKLPGWICDEAGAMWIALGKVYNKVHPLPPSIGRSYL